jgi:hypothetical protein
MEFERKLLGAALSLAIAAGIGEYALYKKFEHTPNPIREVVRWPNNDICVEVDNLAEQYTALKESPLAVTPGRIKELEVLQGYSYCSFPFNTRTKMITAYWKDSINFIKLEDGRRFAYVGDFFAGKSDEVRLTMLPSQKLIEAQKFLERVKKFRIKNHTWLWTTRGYEDILSQRENIRKVIENIPQIKLTHLDGLIDTYEIIKDD